MSAKKIIILVIVLIILIGGAAFGIVYLKTDLFKPIDNTFYKYMFQNVEMLKGYKDSEYLAYDNKLKEMTHTNSGDVTFTTKSNDQDEQIKLDNLTVNIEGKSNPGKNKEYQSINMKYSNDDFFELEYIKDQDKYALKSNEIVNKYVAIENNELKDLATKLNIEDIDKIPNKLERLDYGEIFNITPEEIETIKSTYITTLKNQIPVEKFSKNEKVQLSINNQNIIADSYTLELTSEEVKNVQIKLLEKLKEDDFTLNLISKKMKLLNSSDESASIDTLKTKVQNKIEEILKLNYIDSLKITVFVSSGTVVKTEISTDSEKIEFNTLVEEEKITTNINIKEAAGNQADDENSSKNNEESNTSISISKEKQGDQTIYVLDTKTEDGTENTAKFNITSTYIGLASGSNVENKVTITSNDSETMIKANYRNKVTFGSNVEIEDLDDNNSATLNNFDKDNLNTLVSSIITKTQEVLFQKLSMLGMNSKINLSSTKNVSEEYAKTFNTIFESNAGEKNGADTKAFVSTLVSTNDSIEEDKKVALSINDAQYTGKDITSQSIEEIKNAIDQNKTYIVSFEYNDQTKLINKVVIKEKQ